jgi:hypothetical protein
MPDSGPVLRPAMKFRDVMLEIARRLRFVSRQFEIPRRFAAFSHLEGTGDLPPPIPFEHLFGSSGAMVRDYMVATAITREHLEQLAALPADFTIPAHADILVATGLRGDHFHRFHRYPGDHPVISTRFLA